MRFSKMGDGHMTAEKGDGFVWIKRKHYFPPELNHQFFANYSREARDAGE
jgi:hypothetical protein